MPTSTPDAGRPAAAVLCRPAVPDDAEALAGILNPIIAAGTYTVIEGPLSAADERAYIEGFPPAGVFLVAERRPDGVVGFQNVEPFAGYTRAFDHVGVLGTFVRLDRLRTGVGRTISSATFAAARAAGYRKLFTYVRADNPASLAFHRALGFAVVGTAVEQARIAGRYVDEIIIERFL
jgi:L-amino acid N-acyltransferase YncA